MRDYVKKNDLSDNANETMINADAELKEIFGRAQATMFEITNLTFNHPG